MSAEAATYLTHGKKADGRNASMVMVHAKTTHVIHSSCQTHLWSLSSSIGK